jgi:precorrin-6A/cobalt-precorrin-6A reductase
MTILILGGTAEARALARALVHEGRAVVSSLAGRVSDPALPAGEVRVGGFGGSAGLERFLAERSITAVVDATHPFAAQMSQHARLATELSGPPLLRLARPGWSDHPRARSWIWVADTTQAVVQATTAARPFLTTGRQSLSDFLPWSQREVLVRVVEPPSFPLPAAWRLIRCRGPYVVADERRLMLDHATDALVTKDSGGDYTSAKLDAAGELGLPVVVIARPPVEAGTASVASVTAALEWCRARS